MPEQACGALESDEGQEPFVSALRWALRHLYDPDALRRSPLLALFGLDEERGSLALQRILLDAIEALRPRNKLSQQAKAWRIYRALYHRYTEQFPQWEVAKAMGLSKRQLHRQENEALRALAAQLCTHHRLQSAAIEGALAGSVGSENPTPESLLPSREQELRWLADSLPCEPATIAEVLQNVLKVSGALAQTLDVVLQCELPEGLGRLAVQRATARQAILTALTAAMHSVPGGRVELRTEVARDKIHIRIQPQPATAAASHSLAEASENLDMARRLLALNGGTLEVAMDESGSSPFSVHLVLPTTAEATILVVDDNEDTLRLFERYLAGGRYRFVGTRDPQQVLALATMLRPEAIVLDVMLPGIDGWELLGNLRQDPDTRTIPVLVCSILPEEPLALALGAAAFLRKPVSRVDFVAAVDRQVASPGPGLPV